MIILKKDYFDIHKNQHSAICMYDCLINNNLIRGMERDVVNKTDRYCKYATQLNVKGL